MSTTKLETLKNMNNSTQRFATWCIRIVDPKVIPYEFTARGEVVMASKFQCVIVSKDAKQYMLGLVPFSFADRDAASKAAERFKQGSVWQLKTPGVDTKSKPEFQSTPVKSVLLLTTPSQLVPTEEKEYPAEHVEVTLDLKQIMASLKSIRFPKNSSPGSARSTSKVVDFCAKIISLSEQKPAESKKSGKQLLVSELVLLDSSGGQVKVSVWDEAHKAVAKIPNGEGAIFIGCSATKDSEGVKLNLWGSAHVIRGGSQAQSLTGLDPASLDLQVLTAVFSPTAIQPQVEIDQHEAFPTCAAALADVMSCQQEKCFQINHCYLEVSPADLFAPDGSVKVVQCRLRDRTGPAEVQLVEAAVPAAFGCKDIAEVKAKAQQGTLQSAQTRVNVRGVLRPEGAVCKKLVAAVGPSPLIVKVSSAALQSMLGLHEIGGDVVIPAPLDRVLDVPLVGLSVKSDAQEYVSAYRVLLLLEGSEASSLEPLDEGRRLQDQTFKVCSSSVRCLLSEQDCRVNLVGYCDFGKMLTYRLDTDVALVLVSSFTASPDSVSEATVEWMVKVNRDQKQSLLESLSIEWKSILQVQAKVDVSAADYWEQPATKLRRLASEAATPKKRPL